MNKNPIGILDSGVGGLSVWREIHALLPEESVLYAADTLNCPYGALSEEEIYNNAIKMIEFLVAKGVKLIVVACNTITVTCIDQIRETLPDIPLIGTVPVVKTAAEVTKNGKIGLLSTLRTSESDYQKQLISRFARDYMVANYGTNKIVPFIERGEVHSQEFIQLLERELGLFKQLDVDTVVLGCTHYPFVRDQIQAIMGEQVALLDSGGAIARHVKRILIANYSLSFADDSTTQFFVTGDTESFEHSTSAIFGEKLHAQHISLEAF